MGKDDPNKVPSTSFANSRNRLAPVDGVYTYQTGSNFPLGLGSDDAGGGTQYWAQNGPVRYTDPGSQGGTAADPNFFFHPTAASGGPEFSPPAAGTIDSQRDADYGPPAW